MGAVQPGVEEALLSLTSTGRGSEVRRVKSLSGLAEAGCASGDARKWGAAGTACPKDKPLCRTRLDRPSPGWAAWLHARCHSCSPGFGVPSEKGRFLVGHPVRKPDQPPMKGMSSENGGFLGEFSCSLNRNLWALAETHRGTL